MKLIIFTLIIFNLIINFTNGYEYINFIPHYDSDCSEVSREGVGYSIVVDTCFTLDNTTNHVIQLRGESEVIWKDYYDVGGSTDCLIPIQQPTGGARIGDCIIADFTFNSFLQPITLQPIFYKIDQSSEPELQPNSYVTTFMSDQCDDDQVLLAQYILNDTKIAYGSKANLVTFFCDPKTNLPFTQFCPPGSDGSCFPPKSKSMTCHQIVPFFNSSSEEFPPTTGAASLSSGSVVSTGNPNGVGSTISTGGASGATGGDSSGASGSTGGGVTSGDDGDGSGTGISSGNDGGGPTGGGGGGPTGIVTTGGFVGSNGDLINDYSSNRIKLIEIDDQFAFSSSSSYQNLYYTSIYCEQ
ncbi:hypothetical protein RB653_000262 [Dictyostelium firmibasis]|uniref:Uncharacterized protein n=1 Tax=Dictyostelium firmibasis TaxID=79012 RepID=A0AAN7TWD8_9MYCE